MAQIEIIDEDSFRKECEQMDESGVLAQLLIQHGAAHALKFLQRKGATPELVTDMVEQIERNVGIISQIVAARGIDLPIELA